MKENANLSKVNAIYPFTSCKSKKSSWDSMKIFWQICLNVIIWYITFFKKINTKTRKETLAWKTWEQMERLIQVQNYHQSNVFSSLKNFDSQDLSEEFCTFHKPLNIAVLLWVSWMKSNLISHEVTNIGLVIEQYLLVYAQSSCITYGLHWH